MAESTAAVPRSKALDRRGARPGIVDLYLVRGVAMPFLLITLALGAAMMLERALRLVQEMAATGADIGYFLVLLSQLAPYYLDLAIPAGFMIALVLLVARLDDRQELEAMLSSGLSLARIAAPLAGLGVVIGLVALYVGGWLEPHGRYGFRTTRLEALNAGRIARLQPRALYHPVERLTLTFDRRDAAGRVGGIFVWQRLADGSALILTSPVGEIGFAPQRRAFGINLIGGRYVSERPQSRRPGPHVLDFDTLAFRESLHLEETGRPRGKDQKEMTLAELIAARRSGSAPVHDRALATDLYSRLARAASIPLIPLLVLPLAFATKRGRRGVGILAAFLLFSAFHHLLNLTKQLAYDGSVPPGPAIFGVTALFAGLVLLLFAAGRNLPSYGPVSSLQNGLGRALTLLRPRARRLPNLQGRTIALYLASQLGKWSLMALLAIVLLLQMVDLFERGEEFIARGMGIREVLRYALLRLAPTVQQALPIAALAGAMIGFASLGRSHEMTALRAAGISQWKILLMALPVPLLLSVATLFLSEYASPQSQLRFTAWWAATEPAPPAPAAQPRWFRIGDEIVRAAEASPGGTQLRDIEIFRRDGHGLLRERLSAVEARLADGRWFLSNVGVTRFDGLRPDASPIARLAWPAPLQPDDVAAFFASTRVLSSAAALRSLEVAAPVSQSDAMFTTRLYRSAADPIAPVLMLLLALPLAFVSPRTGMAWPAFLYAGGGGLLYLVADGFLTVSAQVGYVPVPVGACAAPLMVALIGVTVLLYAER